jgi:hypothetical protein
VEVRANRTLCTKQSDTSDAERIRARLYHSHRLWPEFSTSLHGSARGRLSRASRQVIAIEAERP